MARLDEQRRELAKRLRNELAAENQLTPVQARLFVRSLQTSWSVPPIAWRAAESAQQFADARRLMHAAGILREIDGESSPDTVGCYQRAAELLEWLCRSSDIVTHDVPVSLLAAGTYQLAGLPAMATSLLRHEESYDGTAGIFAAFLGAEFELVLARSAQFWRDNEALTGPLGSGALLDAAGDDDIEHDVGAGDRAAEVDANGGVRAGAAPRPPNRLARYFIVELVRAIGLFADSLRRGNDARLAPAMAKLTDLTALATRLSSDELWILVNLVEATAKRFAANSIHGRVARLADRAPEQRSRMWRFAREQFARGRGVLWSSQVQGLDRLIASASFALCTPTGSGKTLVANLAIVKELLLIDPQEGPAPLALYLVPSRALANEVETKLTSELGRDLIVTGLYGGADWGITDYWLTADQPVVLIATVEKAEALMRYVGHLLVHRLRLLIIDEAHQVVSEGDAAAQDALAAHNSRPMRLEGMISRLLAIKPDIARIALTAVAGGAAPLVARWMEGNKDAIPVGLGYRSSRQLIGALRVAPGRSPEILLDTMNGRQLYVRGREAAVYLALRIDEMPPPPRDVLNSLPHYSQIYVLWTALHLLEGKRRVLISVTKAPELLMKRFAEAFHLSGWDKAPAFTPPAEPSDRARYDETRAACVDYCGVDSYEALLLDRGIATSHGQMPQRLRRLMTELIDRRICPLTLATATLTEGVNLPFDIIFLTSLERGRYNPDANKNEPKPMSTAEFRNLAGRAGRPGAAESIEGITLVVVSEAPSATAAGKLNEQAKQVEKSIKYYNDLLDRLQKDEAPGIIHSPLATLIQSIITKTVQLQGIRSHEQLLAWFEQTLPEHVGGEIGVASQRATDQLGDSLDELDGFILAASEELARLDPAVDGPKFEAHLKLLWQRTFAHVAVAVEMQLEACFVKRGRAFVEALYPNHEQRRRLYQYGYTPYVGRVFENIAPDLLTELQAAADYGTWTVEQRLGLFVHLGERMAKEPTVGFRVRKTVRDQAILANWRGVLGWWMDAPEALRPKPEELRAWQRFIGDNLEFKLGVAVGAAVAAQWNQKAGDQITPTLETWKVISGLPWVCFWFRELLRWGTLDPLVAFALAQGLARTRAEGAGLRPKFEAWLAEQGFGRDPETLIDPQRFLAWQRSFRQELNKAQPIGSVAAELTGTDGRRKFYDVRPVVRDEWIDWIDAAGYSLARSQNSAALLTRSPARHDFMITVSPGVTAVERTT